MMIRGASRTFSLCSTRSAREGAHCVDSWRAALVGGPPTTRFLSHHNNNNDNHSSSASSASSDPTVLIPPARIIMVRHGESQGNVDESTYATTPDWKIGLTKRGQAQAQQAGQTLRNLLGDESMVMTYCSPYKRTLQTWHHLSQQLDDDRIVGVRQEPRLVEQQFGNFQNPMAVLASKEERHVFGRFFYRFPCGESGLDVYSRVTSFLGSMSRDMVQLRERLGPETCGRVNVLCVTHGLTLRLLVMRYFQLTVEQFEETHNPPNGQLIVMERQQSAETGSYFYRLHDESQALINVTGGEVSTEHPVFWRNQQTNHKQHSDSSNDSSNKDKPT